MIFMFKVDMFNQQSEVDQKIVEKTIKLSKQQRGSLSSINDNTS